MVNVFSEREQAGQTDRKTRFSIPWFHIIGIAAVLAVLALWTLLSELRVVQKIFLPSPREVFYRFQQVKDGLGLDFLRTFFRMIVGLTIGCTAGILAALVMGWSKIANALTNPIIQILKPIPPLVLAPFALLWWGTGIQGIFFLIIFGCFFVMVIDGIEAIKNVPKIYRWAGAALGETRGGIYRRVVLPNIIPSVIGGLRVSVVMAFNLTTLAEFNVASGGLGDIIIRGYRHLRTDILFLGIICVVALALVVDLLVVMTSRKLIKWM